MKISFVKSEQTADKTKTFYFSKPDSYRYNAGQFIELVIDHKNTDDRGSNRWFTLSSSPTEEMLAITTKILNKKSTFKQALDKLKPGDYVTMSEPMGDFVLPKNINKQLLFIAGGIGVTPYRSMCKFIQDSRQRRKIRILYAENDQDKFSFLDLLNNTSRLETTTNKISAKQVKSTAMSMDNPLIYFAGPEPMVESLNNELSKTFTQSQLISDFFPNYKDEYSK